MARYVIRRFIFAVPMLLLISLVLFTVLAAAPGDPAGQLPLTIPAEVREAYREALAKFGRSPKLGDLKRAPFVQLFNLAEDPSESNNLAAAHPDLVNELFALFDAQIAAGRSTPGPKPSGDPATLNYFSGVPKFVFETP